MKKKLVYITGFILFLIFLHDVIVYMIERNQEIDLSFTLTERSEINHLSNVRAYNSTFYNEHGMLQSAEMSRYGLLITSSHDIIAFHMLELHDNETIMRGASAMWWPAISRDESIFLRNFDPPYPIAFSFARRPRPRFIHLFSKRWEQRYVYLEITENDDGVYEVHWSEFDPVILNNN